LSFTPKEKLNIEWQLTATEGIEGHWSFSDTGEQSLKSKEQSSYNDALKFRSNFSHIQTLRSTRPKL